MKFEALIFALAVTNGLKLTDDRKNKDIGTDGYDPWTRKVVWENMSPFAEIPRSGGKLPPHAIEAVKKEAAEESQDAGEKAKKDAKEVKEEKKAEGKEESKKEEKVEEKKE